MADAVSIGKNDVMSIGDQSSAVAVYVQQLKSMHAQQGEVVRFFRSKGSGSAANHSNSNGSGDSGTNYYYSVYGLDAVLVADEYFRTRVSLKYSSAAQGNSSGSGSSKRSGGSDGGDAYVLVEWLESRQIIPRERCEVLRSAILPKTQAVPASPTTTPSTSSNNNSNNNMEGMLPYTNVNQTLYERIVADLLTRRRCAVEVWEKKSATGGGGSGWRRVKRGSPGNVQEFEDIIMDAAAGSLGAAAGISSSGISRGGDVGGGTMCVRVQGSTESSVNVSVGMAFCSTTERVVYIAQFDDNDQFSTLESAMVQTGVAECCHEEENVLRKRRALHSEVLVERLLDVMRRADVAITSLPANRFPAVSARAATTSLAMGTQNSNFNSSHGSSGGTVGGGSGKMSIAQVEEDLESLVSNYNELGRTLSTEMPLALSAAGAVLSQLGLMEDVNNRGYYRLEKYRVGDFMMMDGSAMKALNIVPTTASENTGSSKSHASLFGLVNAHVRTRMGSRCLYRWLRQPLVDVDEIGRRHDLVQGLLADYATRASVMDMIGRGVPDLDRLIKKFHRQTAKLEDLMKVYQAVQVLPELARVLNEFARGGLAVTDADDGENENDVVTERVFNRFHQEFVETLEDMRTKFENLESLTESAIDIDRFRTEHECLIRSDYDEELEELDEELQKLTFARRKILSTMRGELRDVLGKGRGKKGGTAKKMTPRRKGKGKAARHDSDEDGDNDDAMNDDDWDEEESNDTTGIEMRGSAEKGEMFYFRVTHSAGEKVKKAGYAPISEKTGKTKGFCWTTKELKELSSEYLATYSAYRKQMSALAGEVLKVSASYIPVMETCSSLVARLDVMCAFSELSQQMQYVRPTMQAMDCGPEKERIILKGARHPMLEAQPEQAKNKRGGNGVTAPGSFQPNDSEMTRNESHFLIITGPNMGGKSTYCRSVALCVLMAQIGCFVPCDVAEIAVRDCILCRVGASDSTTRGVSTFMSEMLETSTILKNCTDKSLIMIDELGRGTSTYDGFGLAWAISKHIITEKRSFCMFATHFHELTTLSRDTTSSEASRRCVKNLKVLVKAPEDNNSVDAMQASRSGDMLHFLYRVVEGTSDKSLGVAVAKLAHFPHEVLTEAKRKVRQLESLSRWNASNAMGDDGNNDGQTAANDDDAEGENNGERSAKRRKMDNNDNARLYELFPAGSESRRDDVERAINTLLRNHAMNDYADPEKSGSLVEKLHVAVERCLQVSPELRQLVELEQQEQDENVDELIRE